VLRIVIVKYIKEKLRKSITKPTGNKNKQPTCKALTKL
jgi:hypothetical protein